MGPMEQNGVPLVPQFVISYCKERPTEFYLSVSNRNKAFYDVK